MNSQDAEGADAWAALGVPAFDRDVYLQALRQPGAGVAGWAEALGLPADLVQQATHRLREQGLLRATSHARPRLEPVEPQAAARAAIRQRFADVDRFAAAVGALAERLAPEYERGRLRERPGSILEVIEGADAVSARAGELIAGTEHEACAIDAPPYVSGRGQVTGAQAKLLRRKTRFRTLYASDALEAPQKLAEIMESVAAGEEARVVAEAPLKLLIVDGRTALLPLTVSEDERRHRSVIVNGSALVDALKALFEALWWQAAPLRGRGRTPDLALLREDGLLSAEQELIELLGAGMTDEAIARHYGVSVRTLRRRVRELQDRLGSVGRFQAGVRAAQRGWL
ncbi:helix-turn-helix transcriptional regulator [Streptomyces sp. NPDC002928]|uniref:helix-turn-helix transcriptional regulator n=1 Tax=Streptomyces sp. NPDC002928 TaxID=3154440 RepID=UPI0033A155DB